MTNPPSTPLHVSMEPLAASVARLGREPRFARNVRFTCLNPHSYEVARRTPAFWAALAAAEVLIADGAGITLARRALRQPVPPRITGFDATDALCRHYAAQRGGGRVFLLGSSPPVLARMTERIAHDYPGLAVTGTLSPPMQNAFSAAEARAFAARINATGTDLLLVGLTAPKQELLIEQMHPHLDVGAIAAIGAVFDFLAGTKPRAPQVVGQLGLEWVWRLVREPRRMWRRTFNSGLRFVGGIISGRVSRDII